MYLLSATDTIYYTYLLSVDDINLRVRNYKYIYLSIYLYNVQIHMYICNMHIHIYTHINQMWAHVRLFHIREKKTIGLRITPKSASYRVLTLGHTGKMCPLSSLYLVAIRAGSTFLGPRATLKCRPLSEIKHQRGGRIHPPNLVN
jgi:hypothetical protein